MSFGKKFGLLIKSKRGIEGLTQQELAVKAFGDEGSKARISDLENGKVDRPQVKTVDALAVALNISTEEINEILNQEPYPRFVDNLIDFFDPEGRDRIRIEVAISAESEVYLFHTGLLKVSIRRVEYFVEDSTLVFLEESGKRRPCGMKVVKIISDVILKAEKILFVQCDSEDMEKQVIGKEYNIKIIY